MVKTSLIKKIDKDSIEKIIFLNKYINKEDTIYLKEEFDLNSNVVKHLLDGYRNTGLVLNLFQQSEGLNFDWTPFISRIIINNDIINKLDNVFVNKDSNKVFLITTKRLLKVDLNKLNAKIELINEAIHRYNVKLSKEKREIEHELGI